MILAEEDRARFGCDERLPFDPTGVTNKEAVELARFGKWATPRLWYRALNLRPVYLDDGIVTVLGEDDGLRPGEEPFDFANDPVAWTAAVWVTLRRAGIVTNIDDLEFNLQRLRIVSDDDDENPVPKDDVEVEETTEKTSTGS